MATELETRTEQTPRYARPARVLRGRKPEAVRVRVLGTFRVSVGARTIEEDGWRLKKAAGLVKLLALAPDHRMHREQAMDLLWPNLGKRAASNNLRQALRAARRALDPHPGAGVRLLSSSDEVLVLGPEGGAWVDAEAFEEAAGGARRTKEASSYRAALDLYNGELLPGDRYEEWAEAPRSRLRNAYLSLLDELAGLQEERGDLGYAAELLGRIVEMEPTNEDAHASLMRVFAFWGRRGEALCQYGRLEDALARGLGSEPSASMRALREEIAAGRYPPRDVPRGRAFAGTAEALRHNLPAPMTSFVDREREVADVKRALASTRLLTLTGAGGSGKTRLALEVAKGLAGTYPDGAWIAELAPLSEGAPVAQEIAGALGMRQQPGRPIEEALVDALRSKRMILLLDNCEHLLGDCAELSGLLLGVCPGLKVLATSREPLAVAGEVLWRVPPLPVPGDATAIEELAGYGAVRLFVERTRLRLPDFRITPGNARAVAQICRRLEGLPLAIELAAGRAGTLAMEQLAGRLQDSLKLLSTGPRTASPRQRTMRAAIGWSYGLLSEEERFVFARLSVFAGGFTLEAAEAVCPCGTVERGEVLDRLSALVDKSLVAAEADGEGRVRYRMLEPIRQYANEKLEEGREAEQARYRHADFFLALAEEAEPELAGPRQGEWVERLEAEHDNLRGALSWLLKRAKVEPSLRFVGALWRFWYARGYLSEGIGWLGRALEGSGSARPRWQVKALEGMGWLTQRQGDTERAVAAYEEMLTLSRGLGDKANTAAALNSLGTLAVTQGDNEAARRLLEENLSVLRELESEPTGDTTYARFHALNLLGILAINHEGDYARGAALWEESLAAAREAGDANHVGTTLCNLGYAALLRGDYERATIRSEAALATARTLGEAGVEIVPETLINLGLAARGQGHLERSATLFKEALVSSREMGVRASIINALEGMAGLAGALGRDDRAARLWGAAEAARELTGIALPPGERELHGPHLAGARSRLGEAAWKETLVLGRSMSLDEAAGYALSKGPVPPSTVPVPEARSGEPEGRLTRREQEVAVRVARGLTNRQVSNALGISERTAGNHVARILRKLGLRSRAQIAGWVTEHEASTRPGPDQASPPSPSLP